MAPSTPIIAIILAAGKGTRMRSARPKVLHPVAGQPMIVHVLSAAAEAGATHNVVVLGHAAAAVRAALPTAGLTTVVQEPQRGTGHAVATALEALPETGAVASATALILYGDMPLLTAHTLRTLIEVHSAARGPLSLLSVEVGDPQGYGRVLRDAAGAVVGVREDKELSAAERAIREINCGVYCCDLGWLRRAVTTLPMHPDGEYYLPDLIPVALASGAVVAVRLPDSDEAQGVNTRVQLAAAERTMRARINEEHMLAGVTIIDPATTYIERGVQIGPDTTLYPDTHLRGATTIGADCIVGPASEIVASVVGDRSSVVRSVVEESHIGRDCRVGPFSHLRRGAILDDEAEIGNYAEVKNSQIGRGSVSHHVSYIGDTTMGRAVNIGAGTVTCNYDGVRKHATIIGDAVFVGSGTLLRAPVTLGDRSVTGAGAVVLHDVPADATVAGVPARRLDRASTATHGVIQEKRGAT